MPGSVLHVASDLDSLESFVYALNTTAWKPIPQPKRRPGLPVVDAVQMELHRLVKAWVDSGPNVIKLFAKNCELAEQAQSISAHIIPTKTPRAKVICVP